MTAGESHGPAVVAVVDGVPSMLPITAADVDRDLARRQAGYGRGGRMAIESDRVRILSGVRAGLTVGSPVTLLVENRDHANWTAVMSAEPTQATPEPLTTPRPGHGDMAGMLKFGSSDARDILERASARETAARVAAGAVARRLLEEVGMTVRGRVLRIGGAVASPDAGLEDDFLRAEEDAVRCADPEASAVMMEEIDRAAEAGDSLGGVLEVCAFGLPPGIGSHAQADRRLDAALCAAVVSIPGVKGVEVGSGFALGARRGSEAHDEIFIQEARGLYRETNRAGGIEAGMSNGEPVVLRAVMKPIPTLGTPLATVDLSTGQAAAAFKERADVCAVPAASVVAEAVVAFAIAVEARRKFGGDSLGEMRRNMDGYLDQISQWWRRR